MATIVTKTEGSLLVVSVTGNLVTDEVIAVATKYYTDGIVKDVIWDITNGSLNLIPRSGFELIARATRDILQSGFRKGGKTVFVGSKDAEFGLMRMYSVIADMTGISIEYKVYKSIDEAKIWITGDL